MLVCEHACVRVCVVRYLKLPEDAPGVSVIVLSQRDVFYSSLLPLQVAFHVFKEPGLKVQSDPIDLSRI